MSPQDEWERFVRMAGLPDAEIDLAGAGFLIAAMEYPELDLDHQFGQLDSLAERLDCDLSRPIDTLSQGNRQKIAVINAFMHEPEISILDEPTTGLDPLIQQEFASLILEVKEQGRTVFLSSHILPEVEELCDRVAIIRQGRIVAVETIEALKSLTIRRLKIDFAGPVDPADFSNLPGIRNLDVSDNSLQPDIPGSLDALIKRSA